MNMQYRSPSLPLTTRAAEGLERRRWTVAELEAAVAAGVLDEDERFELIGGEVVPMSPKGNRHELMKNALIHYWVPRMPTELRLATETTFRITADSFLEPDFVFYRKADGLVNLKPANALLVVEVADSSLGYDLGRKARLYAGFGIAELWVIDAVKLLTHVHRDPGGEDYRSKMTVAPDQLATPQVSEALTVRLADLELV